MPTYITLAEVMELTRKSRSTILEHSEHGYMPAPRKLGPYKTSRLVWKRDDVLAWLEGQEKPVISHE